MEGAVEKLGPVLIDKGFAWIFALGMLLALLGVIAVGIRWAWFRVGERGPGPSPDSVAGALAGPQPGETMLCSMCPHRRQSLDKWTADDLRFHRFWRFMDYSQDVTIPRIRIAEPGRRVLAIDFLVLKFRHASTQMHTFIERDDLETMSPVELEDGIVGAIERAITGYEVDALQLAQRKAGIAAMSVYVERFREVHQVVVAQVLDHIVATCQSQWLGDNVTKTASILDFLMTVFTRTIADAERTLGRLNGQLSGLSYDGITIGPCPVSMTDTPTRPTIAKV